MVDTHLSPTLLPTSQSLTLITNPSGDSVISAGETFALRVTVGNAGSPGAIIDLFIDDSSGVLKTWCPNPYERFALSSGSSSEVIFSFPIPVDAIPGNYTYLLVIDAPKHYPEETPIRHQATLQVLPPIQAAIQSNDPTFTLTPASSPEKPTLLEPGQSLHLKVLVHNRSNRVDRFRLTCTDLPALWWEVHYPEGINELGLVIIPDYLALNPGAQGEITLAFRFPLSAAAGRYLPTLRLMGENDPDLILLEVVYLEVLPRYDLRMELRTVVGKVSREEGRFELRLDNGGNTLRRLSLRVREDEEKPICVYQLSRDWVELEQQEQGAVGVGAKPGPWWRRPLVGEGRSLNFYVELVDEYRLPLPTDRVAGVLLWQARPWWQLVLGILIGFSALGLLVLAIWWWWLKPPAPPRIDEFASSAPAYAAANDDFIYLNWEIRHPKQVQGLKIEGRSPNGNRTSTPVEYDLRQGLPADLKEFCRMSRRLLVCQNVRTDARQPGDYLFELTVMPKREENSPMIATSNRITIAPFPIPEITEFKAEVAAPPSGVSSAHRLLPVLLSWKITHPEAIAELGWISRSPEGVVNSAEQRYDLRSGLPEQWRQFCRFETQVLVCAGVPVAIADFPQADRNGQYTFELTVVPDPRIGAKPLSKLADRIEIKPPEPSKILEFQPTAPRYEMVKGEEIRLNWTISHPDQIAALVLQGRSAEGLVALLPVQFSFTPGLPESLKPFCTVSEQLRCRNVPTSRFPSGNYQWQLGVIPQGGTGEATHTQITDMIAIVPPPTPEVVQVQPTQTSYAEEKGEEIGLSWEITQANQLQEIQLIGRDRQGLAITPIKRYSFSQGLPPSLQPHCQLAGRLVCQNVPTAARQPGEYIFELNTIGKQNTRDITDSQQTQIIPILPRTIPLAITQFTVNGEPAPLRVVVTLKPNQRPEPLNLSWQVVGAPNTQVQLLPSPGTVPPTGTLAYPLSQQPGQETLTLRVAGDGQQLQRTLVIETIVLPPDAADTTPRPNQPLPAEPDGLSPADLPPQFD